MRPNALLVLVAVGIEPLKRIQHAAFRRGGEWQGRGSLQLGHGWDGAHVEVILSRVVGYMEGDSVSDNTIRETRASWLRVHPGYAWLTQNPTWD